MISVRHAPAWAIGVAGLVVATAFALRILIPYGLDPTIFASFGNGSTPQDAYVRDRLGQISTRSRYAHDGKYYFIQANDPWLSEPHQNAALLDRPIYRSQRMLYPVLVGGFGLFPPEAIVWSMLLINIVAMAIGAAIAASLAASWELPAWLGLLVPLNIGLLFELEIGGAGILAYALCLTGLYALVHDRAGIASVLFTAAALTREVMVLFPAGLLLLWVLERRPPAWRIITYPIAAVALWNIYIRIRLSGVTGTGVAWGNFSAPFYGILQAFGWWLRYPHLLINIAIIGIVAMFGLVAIRSRSPIAWGALPFIALSTVLSDNVWRETFDVARAVAPVFTAIPFVVLSPAADEPRSVR